MTHVTSVPRSVPLIGRTQESGYFGYLPRRGRSDDPALVLRGPSAWREESSTSWRDRRRSEWACATGTWLPALAPGFGRRHLVRRLRALAAAGLHATTPHDPVEGAEPHPPLGGSGTGSFLLHHFSTNRVDSRGLRWIPVDSTAANKRLTSNVLDHNLRVVS